MRIALILFVWIAGFYNLFSQRTTYWLEAVNIPNAPPLATIDCIFEDSRGLMWLGCYSGLYRYDGYSIKHYTNDPDDSLSISDNKIKTMLEDKQGNFWVGTQVGLNYFDFRKNIFKRFTDKRKGGLGDVDIFNLKWDAAGNVWVADAEGLYRYDPDTKGFIRFFPTEVDSTSILAVFAFEMMQDGVYLFTRKGAYFKSFSDAKVTPVSCDGPESLQFFKSYKDPFGRIWLGSEQGLYFLDTKAQKIEPYAAVPKVQVRCLLPDTLKNELWVVTSAGVFIVNTQTQACRNDIAIRIKDKEEDLSQMDNACFTASGIVWFASSANDLYKLNTQKQYFKHIPLDFARHSLSVLQLFELYEYSPGVLLISYKGEPNLLNIHTGQIKPFPYRPDYNKEAWKAGMTCFFEEPNGRLWIGGTLGLYLFDKKSLQFINPEKQDKAFSALKGLTIRKIHIDRNRNLWLATWWGGVFKYNLDARKMTRYFYSKEAVAQKLANTRSITETASGAIWVGTRGGLLQYNTSADTFKVYKNIPGDTESMSENTAFCIQEDPEGYIWCGTYGGGLNRLDPKTGKFKYFTTKDGLANNNVFSLQEDQSGNYWLMGFSGLSRFNPVSSTCEIFTNENGLLNKEFAAFMSGKSRYDDWMFFGGKSGIDYFNPAEVRRNDFIPNVLITDFKLFNESVPVARGRNSNAPFTLAEDISFTPPITLRYDQNVITLDYVALDFASPETIQYAYQLEGFDKDWQYIGHKRSVTFTNLNPGTYHFKVKASNGDGVWNEGKITTLQIKVLSPWWRTNWFIGLVIALMTAILYVMYQYRIRQIREKEAIRANLNQRIAAAKMEALQSQMNPHFIFNCLSSLKWYVEKQDTEKASLLVSKFSKLIRQVLDHSRSDAISLADELDTLKRYVELEQMRYKEKFDFQIEISPELPLDEIQVPPLIVQPFIENAIWHGLQHKASGKRILFLKLSLQAGGICQIIVQDNGVGRAAAAAIKERNKTLHQSHGLNVTAERMALFNLKYQNDARIETNDLQDETGTPCGTQVILSFHTNMFH